MTPAPGHSASTSNHNPTPRTSSHSYSTILDMGETASGIHVRRTTGGGGGLDESTSLLGGGGSKRHLSIVSSVSSNAPPSQQGPGGLVKHHSGSIVSASEEDLIQSPSAGEGGEHHSNPNTALYHIVCVIAGTGILQLPFALKQAGWLGIIVILFSAFVNEYTGKLLIECLYVDEKRLDGYPDIGHRAFGILGRRIVDVFYNMVLLGVAALYIILAGMSLHDMTGVLTKNIWVLMCCGALWIVFVSMRTLKEVSIISLFGALASVIVVLSVFIMGIYDSVHRPPEVSQAVTFSIFNIATFPIAMGSICFSFGGNFIYPEVEASMADKTQFPSVLRKSLFIILIMYGMTAIVGYAVYGDDCVSPILENLPNGPAKIFVIAVVTTHVLLACPALLTTFSMYAERSFSMDNPIDSFAQKVKRVILRTITIVFVAVIAIFVSFFADLMAFIGAVANTMLIFIFPIVFHYKLYGWRGRSWKEHVISAIIMIVGAIGGVIGGAAAVLALYNDFTGVVSKGPAL